MEIYTGQQLGKAAELERLGGINKDVHRDMFIKELMIKQIIINEGARDDFDIKTYKKNNVAKYYEYSNKALGIYGNEEKRKLRNHYDFFKKADSEKVLEIIERSQLNSDPTKPRTAWAADLRNKLIEKINIKPENIKYYSAVESCTEGIGIDAYFKIKVPGFKEETVYFDFTIDELNEKMKKGTSPHSVILSNYPIKEVPYDKETEAEYIENFSNIIIQNLKSKLSNQKR